MYRKIISLVVCSVLLAAVFLQNIYVLGASKIQEDVDSKLVIKESEVSQLITDNIVLPEKIEGYPDAAISYTVHPENQYASVKGNTLVVNRPYAGAGDYSCILKATVSCDGDTAVKEFPITIHEGVSDDSYAGYVYVCFTCENLNKGKDERDSQQVHFYLSQDGLNWVSVNGNRPAFTAGNDYLGYIKESSYNFDNSRVINYGISEDCYSEEYVDYLENGNERNRFYEYNVMDSVKLKSTEHGDASALYPFDGNDQGIRDPYIIRGCKADGSDRDKVWILATDLNIMADKYGDKVPCSNFNNSVYGNWGYMNSEVGSQNLFVYESSDKMKSWTRRYIDVGSSEKLSESAGIETNAFLKCVWAPEAIYNPKKDNYLVYWSSDLSNAGMGKMIFCCETDDFENFGDVRLYVNEKARTGNGGFSCIDASQMQVVNDDGSYSYYRVIKDESDAHINLEMADTVLVDGKDYEDRELFRKFIEKPSISTAGEAALGNHFTDVRQTELSAYRGCYEGATLFPFYDRKEWCVMVDNYGYMAGRYFPLVSYDLSEADSVKTLKSGYGRSIDEKTGIPEVACHGGMMPITAAEYNSIIDTYNSDDTIPNYHHIDYIEVDKRMLKDTLDDIVARSAGAQLNSIQNMVLSEYVPLARKLMAQENATSAEINSVIAGLKRYDETVPSVVTVTDNNKQNQVEVNQDRYVSVEKTVKKQYMNITGKKSVKVGKDITLKVELNNIKNKNVTWKTVKGKKLVTVKKYNKGRKLVIKGKKKGKLIMYAKCGTLRKKVVIRIR